MAPALATAQMGMGNAAPVVDSITVSPSPAQPNAATTIGCNAHDLDGLVTRVQFTVTGGTLPNGTATQLVTLATPAAAVAQSIAWTSPIAGAYSVTCTAFDNGGLFGGSASGTLTVPATVAAPTGLPPVLSALTASSLRPLGGETVLLTTAATDPQGGALSWFWSATGGTVVPNGETATWTAPVGVGAYAVTVRVEGPTGLSSSASVVITVELKHQQAGLPAVFRAPRRVVASPTGQLYVVDSGTGTLWMLTPRGDPQASPAIGERATAVTLCGGSLRVSTASGKLLAFDPTTLRPGGSLALAGGPLAGATGLACDETRGWVFAAERDANRVRAIRPDGTTAFTVTNAGADRLKVPADVAVDPSAGTLWVALESNETGSLVHAFSLDGAFQRSIAPNGSGDGQLSRGGGLAVGAGGEVYVTDFFQGVVKTFAANGAWVGQLGVFGAGVGALQRPSGMAWLSNGDLVVANLDVGRLERFGTGAVLPDCPGDSDCDGLPDAWESAFGFNPRDPRDALLDADGDGLTNLEEKLHGTNPRNADTDGDGYTDGEELLAGTNPLDPNDPQLELVAGAPTVSDPGLVTLAASIKGRGPCQVVWAQVGGPTVSLRDATTPTPSFVGREAGDYRFSGSPHCGAATGPATLVAATVREVAPRAEPGRTIVVRAGETFLLDGAFSSDANGQKLVFGWDQTLGPPRLAAHLGPAATVRAYRPGLYTFQLTATDPTGLASIAEVPVLVVDEERQAPTAMVSSPVAGQAGQAVVLDASASTGPKLAKLQYQWRQTVGPATTLSAATSARPSFVPASAGRYAFEVVAVTPEGLLSPAELVEVFVSDSAGLPVAIAPAVLAGPVGEPLSLDGAGSTPVASGGNLSYRWRQVAGPAAGLTRADEKVASVVPFESGTYLFELRVTEGLAESVPAIVRLDADKAGLVRPVAAAAATGLVIVGEDVVLDAAGSTAAGGASLRYLWTQVAGPWVALDDPNGAVAQFTAQTAGLYAFELVVDDGAIRSAPARVGVLVFPRSPGGGR